jgi:hypothetical protein
VEGVDGLVIFFTYEKSKPFKAPVVERTDPASLEWVLNNWGRAFESWVNVQGVDLFGTDAGVSDVHIFDI